MEENTQKYGYKMADLRLNFSAESFMLPVAINSKRVNICSAWMACIPSTSGDPQTSLASTHCGAVRQCNSFCYALRHSTYVRSRELSSPYCWCVQ